MIRIRYIIDFLPYCFNIYDAYHWNTHIVSIR